MQPETSHLLTYRIGIDIGGTFTDFVVFNSTTGEISTFKLPSTPLDPSEAVLKGFNMIRGQLSEFEQEIESRSLTSIIHGSTVATNALLERKGAPTALITTQGFKDVIQIGRQNRPNLYDFKTQPPEPLIPADLRFELEERIDQFGDVLTSLDEKKVDALITDLKHAMKDVESIAVVFLFSFANPKHEQIVTKKLRDTGYSVSASHEILPEYREYERTSTTVINAYVSPVLERYLKRLEDDLPSEIPLQIMQSNGGSISVAEARKSGVRCILSGPAGGVVGCQFIGDLRKDNQHPSDLQLLTFDMGGTSTDVSLIEGKPQVTSEAEVGGLPIRVPVLDIHTIGAGGGSIAYIDAGGALRVGPKSAGADPGPACYGRGEVRKKQINQKRSENFLNFQLATVTDANLVLGRIPPDRFLGGKMPLFPKLAESAIAPLANKLGFTPAETALGIIEIANAHMERALRVISVERGHDPRDFTLLSFGGAGSLHAADLARRLHIPKVLIPPYAATLSAFGMLAADVVKDYTQTVMLPGDTTSIALQTSIAYLLDRAQTEITTEGFSKENIHLEPALDMRYRGQSFELTIPFTENIVADFHAHHLQTYGYQRLEADVEIVNLRVRGTGLVAFPKISEKPQMGIDSSGALIEYRSVVLAANQKSQIPFYHGEALQPGNNIPGPAIVVRDDTTIMLNEADTASVDPYLNLIININY